MNNKDSSKLPQELEQDMEYLSRNVHESWMRQRQGEGWSYAKDFDNQKKTTPNMVDYADLPESEKEVDRATVRQVICSMLELGYRFRKE